MKDQYLYNEREDIKIGELLNKMVSHVHIHVYTDGASRKNPGPSAIGIVFLDDQGSFIAEHKECVGIGTNNEAEYKAVLKALELGTAYCRGKVSIFSDSELVINQLTGKYAIKKNHLRKLCMDVKDTERLYQEVVYNHVPRENPNTSRADKLSNEALDGQYGVRPSVHQPDKNESLEI